MVQNSYGENAGQTYDNGRDRGAYGGEARASASSRGDHGKTHADRGEQDRSYRSGRGYGASESGATGWNDDTRGYGNDDSEYYTRGANRTYGGRSDGWDPNQGGYGRASEAGGRPYSGGGYGGGYRGDFNRGVADSYDRSFEGERFRGSTTGPGGFGARYGSGGYGRQDGHEFGSSYYGQMSARNDERGWFDRAGDEVMSWFGDEDAERRREQDKHRGKGPKNYVRSDERIKEDVSDQLSHEGALDATDVEVMVEDGEVTLNGTVANRFAKRRAEDCCERVAGVGHIQNNLRVQDRDRWSSGDANSATATKKTRPAGSSGLTSDAKTGAA